MGVELGVRGAGLCLCLSADQLYIHHLSTCVSLTCVSHLCLLPVLLHLCVSYLSCLTCLFSPVCLLPGARHLSGEEHGAQLGDSLVTMSLQTIERHSYTQKHTQTHTLQGHIRVVSGSYQGHIRVISGHIHCQR